MSLPLTLHVNPFWGKDHGVRAIATSFVSGVVSKWQTGIVLLLVPASLTVPHSEWPRGLKEMTFLSTGSTILFLSSLISKFPFLFYLPGKLSWTYCSQSIFINQKTFFFFSVNEHTGSFESGSVQGTRELIIKWWDKNHIGKGFICNTKNLSLYHMG